MTRFLDSKPGLRENNLDPRPFILNQQLTLLRLRRPRRLKA
jgi:hypothetical protein